MQQTILDGIKKHTSEGGYPWHMPGHKRRLSQLYPDMVAKPIDIDMTEVGLLDEFHSPEGIIKQAFDRASEIYGSDRSYYLINGSTAGILAAVSACCRSGDEILMARNCHRAVYNAVRLLNLKPVYISPSYNRELKMYGGIDASLVADKIKNNHICAVVITSPTYEGVVSDIEKIAKICHSNKIPLIVDEAHGAHLEFMSNVKETISDVDKRVMPRPAIRLGADIVVESLHKTLPAFTQCSILHARDGIVDRERLEEYLSIYQTSSPSYVFMTSIEACIEKANHERDGAFLTYKQLLKEYRARLSQLENLHLVQESDFKKMNVYGYDVGKIVISVKDCGINEGEGAIRFSGTDLYKMLMEDYGQVLEMAAGDYVIAMTSIADTRDAFEGLVKALETIDSQLTKLEQTADKVDRDTHTHGIFDHVFGRDKHKEEMGIPEYKVSVSAAIYSSNEDVLIDEAAGLVAGEYVYAFPPGIPIIVPGEIYDESVIKMIKEYMKKGLEMKGVKSSDDKITVRVLKDNHKLVKRRH